MSHCANRHIKETWKTLEITHGPSRRLSRVGERDRGIKNEVSYRTVYSQQGRAFWRQVRLTWLFLSCPCRGLLRHVVLNSSFFIWTIRIPYICNRPSCFTMIKHKTQRGLKYVTKALKSSWWSALKCMRFIFS